MADLKIPAILLKRDKHDETTRSIFEQLKSDQSFTDVTLATEDNKTITAHRAILGYSSPYFFSILQANSNSKQKTISVPVKYSHLQALVEYMYLGETRVEVMGVKEFLGVANRLQVHGLWLGSEKNIPGKEIMNKDDKIREECSRDCGWPRRP